MIEWQNESSLFTIRVQGKQWYWVYKFDATAAYNILAAPKNIGHNRWFITVPGESYCADSYYQALHLGAQLEYKNMYFKLLKDEGLTARKLNSSSLVTNSVAFSEVSNNKANTATTTSIKIAPDLAKKIKKYTQVPAVKYDSNFYKNFASNNLSEYKNLLNKPSLDIKYFTGNKVLGFYDFSPIDDSMNFASNLVESVKNKPFRFIRGVLNKHNINLLQTASTNLNKNIIFVPKFTKQSGVLEEKVDDCEVLWGYKQKKYKRLQKFKFMQGVLYDPISFEAIPTGGRKSPFTLKSTLITRLTAEELEPKAFNYQRAIKYNRQRHELVPVNLARRLLRTKRTLVLPAHVNITVITNSYDVVHSWFIPGLGIKLDCVPGRSTHHTFYIDNVGFYYGQCAEICGRYHHHMPVRLCALPFEQFLVWWQKKGLKRLHRISFANSVKSKTMNPDQIKFKYKW